MRKLIVTADDVGLTDGVNRAVEAAYRDGIVTAASVLAVGRAFDAAAAMVARNPGLAVGAHLAIVGEDPPLLSAREIPTLVDRSGNFPLSWRSIVMRGSTGRIDPGDVRREFAAQLERIGGIGVPITHLDTHQHVHLWPAVAAIIAELAVKSGIGYVRTPQSDRAGPVGQGVNLLSRRLRRRLASAGLHTTDASAGLDEAGSLTADKLAAAMGRAARTGAVTLEVNTHPGEPGEDRSRFAWDFNWAEELAMLQEPATMAAVRAAGFEPVSFGGLAADTPHPDATG